MGNHIDPSGFKGPKPIGTSLRDDAAVKILRAEHGDDAWSAEEEKRLVRKIDLRLLWILCLS